ncbi:MAG: hypothetical protein Q8880_06060, partial [Bacteroidota bacterium]|nr:hypothetical protein [Bacteroidota bacterium]
MRIIYLLGIFTSILLFSTELLDYTLVPRFICLAVSVTVIIGMISLKPGFNYIKPGLILSSYLIYIFIKILSVSWAINKAEALFDISRSILGFSVFALTLYFFKLNADSIKVRAGEKSVKNKKLMHSSKQNADKFNESFIN